MPIGSVEGGLEELVELSLSALQVEDSRFEIGDPLLHCKEHCRDRRLGVGRNLVPKLIRDRKRVRHDAHIAPSSNSVNPRV